MVTAVASPTPFRSSRARRGTGVLAQAVVWVAITAAVSLYLASTPGGTSRHLLVGNLAFVAALGYGIVCTILAARRQPGARRAWVVLTVALVLGTLAQLLFTVSLLQGTVAQASPVIDMLSYLGMALPLVIALFLFPRPPERLISRFRGVLDAVVITTAVVLVSEGTVLGVLRQAMDFSTPTGLSSLAYPAVDIALCAVVLTLGMSQPPGRRLAWLCMGTGLVSLAVTDSIYVILLVAGETGLTGTPLVAGWMAFPVLMGLSTQLRDSGAGRRRDLELVSRLVPYVPVAVAAVVLALRPVRSDPFLFLSGGLLLVTVAIRQVMIVYENLSLTRDLEAKVAERTAELATLGSIVTSSRDAIVGFGVDRRINAWNPAAEQLSGFPGADVLGREPDFLPRPSVERIDRMLRAAARGEELETTEIDWTRPDGSTVPVAMTVSPIMADGVVTGISVSAQDITERRRAADALEQAREAALQSARAKSEFLATMSHEIRTPMNGVIGLVSLLMDTDLDPQQRGYAEGVHSAGQALLDVINDILDFSKLEAGKLVLDSDDFDLRRLVEDVGNLLAPAAFAKGLELLVDCDPGATTLVRGDHVRVRQVLLNLASNAVKFTATGEVEIKVGSTPVDGGARVRVEVRDTGIGIAAGDQDRLFESFSQADASTTRRYGGTGLGLAICKRLVEAMGGRIGLASEPGAGSTFWFSLDLPLGQAVEPRPVEPAPALAPGLWALVVDDNATNRTILRGQLSAWGIRVDLVDSAAAALAALATARAGGLAYDLAVLDMLMPDVDGLGLARAVSADPRFAGLPMVMLTSAPRLPQAVLREAGIRRWLNKPVRTAELYDALVRVVGRGGARPAPALDPAPVPARTSEPADAAPTRGRVLIVEDNELNQLVAAGLVEKLGFATTCVGNGAEALDILDREGFDVVLMDCHMPVMDGFVATERIRARERGGRRTTIVALTAGALVSDRERCLDAGMDDYLAKPIERDVLSTVLDRWTGSADATGQGDRRASGPADRDDGTAVDLGQVESLAELRRPDGTSMLDVFVTSFSGRAAARLEALRGHAARHDEDALVAAAHELKGSAATIGAVRVALLCDELEREGTRVLVDRSDLLDTLDVELQRAVDELDVLVGVHA